MQTLSHSQAEGATGGILWTTPVAAALMDTGCFGPLVGAFGAGWTVGTYIYNNWISD